MARFIPTKGPKGQSDYYLDTKTNEVITKRQRAKILRSVFSDVPISNERLARMNLAQNPELALSRPARGRKSLLKVEGVEKATIIEARKEDLKRRKELLDIEKEQAKLERLRTKRENKKVTRQRVTKDLLRPGSYGARVTFNSYADYLVSLKEAKALGVIHSYGLGMVGFDERNMEERAITFVTQQSINNKPLTKEVFDREFFDALMGKQYFVFQYFFMHLAFKKAYAEKHFADWKAAGKPVIKRFAKKRRNKRK